MSADCIDSSAVIRLRWCIGLAANWQGNDHKLHKQETAVIKANDSSLDLGNYRKFCPKKLPPSSPPLQIYRSLSIETMFEKHENKKPWKVGICGNLWECSEGLWPPPGDFHMLNMRPMKPLLPPGIGYHRSSISVDISWYRELDLKCIKVNFRWLGDCLVLRESWVHAWIIMKYNHGKSVFLNKEHLFLILRLPWQLDLMNSWWVTGIS